ncbi:MAG: hypothetical protein JWP97_1957 [Labilithrix sp.]|nr:hypothetical protein [Labilithrix sp.]
MSSPLSLGSLPGATSAPAAKEVAEAAKTKKQKETDADIKKAAAGFEQILVKQMLATAKVAGKGEYADMGVDAVSTAVSSGGGLGLGQAIVRSLGHADHPAAPPQKK